MNFSYTPFKIFHYPDTLSSMSSEFGSPVAPIHVRIKPINLCNHHTAGTVLIKQKICN